VCIRRHQPFALPPVVAPSTAQELTVDVTCRSNIRGDPMGWDNFYAGGVSSVDDPQFDFKFEQVYTDAALQIPWFPILGDHDHCGEAV